MKFHSHNFLRKLKRPVRKYKIKVFDTETYTNKNFFMLGGLNDGTKKTKFFMNRCEMLEYLIANAKKNEYVFAHNLQFDFTTLTYPDNHLMDFKILMKNARMLMCKRSALHKKRFPLIMLDTGNYFQSGMTLKMMGSIVGKEKLCYTHDDAWKKPSTPYEWTRLKVYNATDCLIPRLFMEKFQETLNNLGGELKITIASCAMDLYRRKYIPCTIHKEPFDCKEFVFKSYYGGRTEAFQRGTFQGIWYYYDFNSLYPSVMRNEYPKPQSALIIKHPKIYNFKRYGVSTVTVRCPFMRYPLLPYQSGKKLRDKPIGEPPSKLLFPTGKFKGTYTHIELQRAIELGYKILKIHKQMVYMQGFHPFKAYVEDLYSLRKKYKDEDNEIMQQTCKLLMNSLYGKFASKSVEDTTVYMIDEHDNPINGKNKPLVWCKGDRVASNTEKKELHASYIIPILASYTTAYARLKLHQALLDSDAIYCDTDSIITQKELPHSKELGDLKLEHTLKKVIIVKPKYYYYETDDKQEVRIKGFSKVTIDMFHDTLQGKPVQQRQFTKFKQALVMGLRPNEIRYFDKQAKLDDDKRMWEKKKFNQFDTQNSQPLNL